MSQNELALQRDSESGLMVLDLDPEDSNIGYENQTEADRKKVWLKQLQGSSSECKNKNRVEGAQPGHFYHTGTGRLFKDGVEIICCITESCFVEWKPDGGGFVGKHRADSPKVKEAEDHSEEKGIWPWVTPKTKNKLIDTRYMYILCPGETDDAPWEFATFSVSMSKMDPYQSFMADAWRYRALNSAGDRVKVPLPMFRIKLTSFDTESNGQEYSGLKMEAAVDNDLDKYLISKTDPRYIAAVAINEAFKTGEIKVDLASENKDDVRDADFELIDGKEAF